jgi:MYXO-CTERM domain-containing protein
MRTLFAAVVLLFLGAAGAARAQDLCHSNLMIVLDRSCSMQDPPQAGGTTSKWAIAGTAIGKLLTKYGGMLDFGLIMFPDQSGVDCNQDGPIYESVAPGNESAIMTTLTTTMPTGPCVTNIKPAFDQVSTDPRYAQKYMSGPRGFVLFISDGMQTCGGGVNMIASSVKALYDNGYPTYIVGFGGAVSPASLDMFATAGGVPRAMVADAGGHSYYQADDAAGLDAALDEIAGKVANVEFGGCSGSPCPDGRCFAAGEMCVGGFCTSNMPPDLAGSGGGGGDGGGGPGGATKGGCNCDVGGTPLQAAVSLLLLGAVVALAARRRS